MQKPEQAFWSNRIRPGIIEAIAKHWPQWPYKLERIENIAGNGTPDVHYVLIASTGWIELKSVELPKKESTAVMGRDGLNDDQVNWHSDYARCHARSWILIEGRHEKEPIVWLLPGSYAPQANDLTANQLSALSRVVVTGRWTDPHWRGLVRTLVSTG